MMSHPDDDAPNATRQIASSDMRAIRASFEGFDEPDEAEMQAARQARTSDIDQRSLKSLLDSFDELNDGTLPPDARETLETRLNNPSAVLGDPDDTRTSTISRDDLNKILATHLPAQDQPATRDMPAVDAEPDSDFEDLPPTRVRTVNPDSASFDDFARTSAIDQNSLAAILEERFNGTDSGHAITTEDATPPAPVTAATLAQSNHAQGENAIPIFEASDVTDLASGAVSSEAPATSHNPPPADLVPAPADQASGVQSSIQAVAKVASWPVIVIVAVAVIVGVALIFLAR